LEIRGLTGRKPGELSVAVSNRAIFSPRATSDEVTIPSTHASDFSSGEMPIPRPARNAPATRLPGIG
jgi:hypothetical protein